MAATERRRNTTAETVVNKASSEPAVRLTEAFILQVLADWEAHGATAIAAVRADRPHEYLKLVTGLFPSGAEGRVEELDAFTDERLAAELARTLAQLAAAGTDPRTRTGAEEKEQPPGGLPPLF